MAGSGLTAKAGTTSAPPRRRHLPAVDAVLRHAGVPALIAEHGRQPVLLAVRGVLDEARRQQQWRDIDAIAAAAAERLVAASQPQLQPVFNLTGTILHTNLGRALLAEPAITAASTAMREAVAIEYDLASGKRGERDDLLRGLLCELTGAEDATVVNNNAAAVLLTLNALVAGRQAIVSRGELIEIGGGFRIPEIMERAGVELVEVGTTNRTHLADYTRAIGAETGAIVKIHTSNYRIEGFTCAVPGHELAPLARKAGVPLIDDLGSGTLVDLRQYGLPHEPTVAEAVAAGADIVTFSGDKLLGGPQAGFIVGQRDLIARINADPLKRALRVDKLRLAAIEATLALYRDPERAARHIPTLAAMARPVADIAAQTERLQARLDLAPLVEVTALPCQSQIGSGAVPVTTMASHGLALTPVTEALSPTALAAALRRLSVPVIGHMAADAVILDLRCLRDEERFLAVMTELPARLAATI